MKKLLYSIFFLFILNNTYGQLKLSISVFKDSTLNTFLSNVKINLNSIDSKKRKFKIKSLEQFNIIIEKPKNTFTVEIKKKHYIPILLKIKPNIENEYIIKVILKKALSVHDKGYEGPSKIISIIKSG